MASETQLPRQLGFYVTGGGTGLTSGDFTVSLKRDGTPLTPGDFGFTIVELGSGYYYAKYIPEAAGFYVLTIVRSSDHFIDVVDIEEANYADLTQDTGGVGALKPSLPETFTVNQKTDLQEYVLMVIASSDWDIGRKAPNYSQAMTELDNDGNWLTTPLTVEPGIYHIVIKNNFGVEKVIKAYLEV